MTVDKILITSGCGVTSVSLCLCLFRLLLSINLSINQRRIQDFPGGRTKKGCTNLYLAQIFQKLHENEDNWTSEGGGGGSPKFYYVDLPL